MGFDINLAVEHRVDGQWKPVTDPTEALFWLYNDRNYDLYAILIDISNGPNLFDLFGCVTDKEVDYNSDFRGIPEDGSSEIKKEFAKDWYNSISFCTLQELLNYNWDQKITKFGIVDETQYAVFKEKGYPYSWSGGVTGPMVEHVSQEEMDLIFSGQYAKRDGVEYYTKIHWTVSFKQTAVYFLNKIIPKLRELGEPEDVRIIFGFDG